MWMTDYLLILLKLSLTTDVVQNCHEKKKEFNMHKEIVTPHPPVTYVIAVYCLNALKPGRRETQTGNEVEQNSEYIIIVQSSTG